jgi:hypothetical protein
MWDHMHRRHHIKWQKYNKEQQASPLNFVNAGFPGKRPPGKPGETPAT